jgi:hypothetical protein
MSKKNWVFIFLPILVLTAIASCRVSTSTRFRCRDIAGQRKHRLLGCATVGNGRAAACVEQWPSGHPIGVRTHGGLLELAAGGNQTSFDHLLRHRRGGRLALHLPADGLLREARLADASQAVSGNCGSGSTRAGGTGVVHRALGAAS